VSDKKEELLHLVKNENVSAIETLVDRLELTSDEVVQIIESLLESGELKGTLTDDKKRFFKTNVKLSEAPTIERADAPPSFLSFNTRPTLVTALIGFLIVAGGVIVNANAADMTEQNFAAILILVGLLIAIAGLYGVSRNQTPS
jgi:hypothetical protein